MADSKRTFGSEITTAGKVNLQPRPAWEKPGEARPYPVVPNPVVTQSPDLIQRLINRLKQD